MEVVGLDIGYGYTKAVSSVGETCFPTLIGEATRSRFGLSAGNELFCSYSGREYAVGETALRHSRFVQRFESRGWVRLDVWRILAMTAIARSGVAGTCRVVTGLPMNCYDDADVVKKSLTGVHEITVNNSRVVLDIADVRVVPQPFGSFCKVVFLPNGKLSGMYAPALTNPVGVMDFGSHNTNLIEIERAQLIEAASTAINLGAWDMVRAVQSHLRMESPGAEFRDHELAEAVVAGHYDYYGRTIELEPIVKPKRDELIHSACATATQLWGDGAHLWMIIITGGLAPVVGQAVKSFFSRHERVIVLDNAQMANARGFRAYGMYINQQGG